MEPSAVMNSSLKTNENQEIPTCPIHHISPRSSPDVEVFATIVGIYNSHLRDVVRSRLYSPHAIIGVIFLWNIGVPGDSRLHHLKLTPAYTPTKSV